MLSLRLILAAAAAMALSGLPSCLMPPRSRAGQRLAAIVMCLAGALGLAALLLYARGGGGRSAISLEWMLPWGNFSVALDPLGAVFLALIFVIPPLGSIYGLGYWAQASHPRSGARLSLSFGMLAGAMVLVVLARDGALFLIAWELMALAAYFAATASDEGRALRRAGWIYLVATHAGTLVLFAMFALLRKATGSFALAAASFLAPETANAIFVLALAGFGFKAGLAPLHFWLPDAHANAPSHVSATMSGVMLKMGIYGILRIASLLPNPPLWWGGSLMVVGAVGGIAGIVFAIGQKDVKRVLAYSSVENIGIIAMGAGLALLGTSLGRWELVLLGLGGALLHVWNHALFKSLLFLGAGGIMHATGTRDIERLGGLAKRAPTLAALFLMGAAAISALPPLNGFVGEWILYLGFFRVLVSPNAAAATAAAPAVAAVGAVALAMIGALAVACFVRLYGGVFLGEARTEAPSRARDPGAAMLVPMALLAALCLFLGLFPALVLPAIEAAARDWSGVAFPPGVGADAGASLEVLAPTRWIGALGAVLLVAVAALYLILRLARRKAPRRLTWDCGYARPEARMQYTASSFGDGIVRLFGSFLAPKREKPLVRGAFPAPSAFSSDMPDPVLDRAIMPAAEALDRRLPRFRFLQRGQTHLYILYVLIVTIVLLAVGGMGVPQ